MLVSVSPNRMKTATITKQPLLDANGIKIKMPYDETRFVNGGQLDDIDCAAAAEAEALRRAFRPARRASDRRD
jgi:hypothetical protein